MKIFRPLKSTFRSLAFSAISASIMYFTLKIFDRSVWVKNLSFVGSKSIPDNLPFQNFVLDTRYTFNLIILTVLVGVIGISVYLFLSWVTKSKELFAFAKIFTRQNKNIALPKKEPINVTDPEG